MSYGMGALPAMFQVTVKMRSSSVVNASGLVNTEPSSLIHLKTANRSKTRSLIIEFTYVDDLVFTLPYTAC